MARRSARRNMALWMRPRRNLREKPREDETAATRRRPGEVATMGYKFHIESEMGELLITGEIMMRVSPASMARLGRCNRGGIMKGQTCKP